MVIVLFIILLACLFLPQWWAQYILRRYAKPRPDLPGTGGELAEHLINKFDMQDVGVEVTETGDHYDPEAKMVRLSEDNYSGKSLTAVATAAHEVGHALQDHMGYTPLGWRSRLVVIAQKAEKLGAGLLMLMPIVVLLTRAPVAGAFFFLGGMLSLGSVVIVHLVTLPVEWDASFKRALPILEAGQYLSPEDQRAAHKILLACALTYVAASLASLLNLWRWWAILRR